MMVSISPGLESSRYCCTALGMLFPFPPSSCASKSPFLVPAHAAGQLAACPWPQQGTGRAGWGQEGWTGPGRFPRQPGQQFWSHTAAKLCSSRFSPGNCDAAPRSGRAAGRRALQPPWVPTGLWGTALQSSAHPHLLHALPWLHPAGKGLQDERQLLCPPTPPAGT